MESACKQRRGRSPGTGRPRHLRLRARAAGCGWIGSKWLLGAAGNTQRCRIPPSAAKVSARVSWAGEEGTALGWDRWMVRLFVHSFTHSFLHSSPHCCFHVPWTFSVRHFPGGAQQRRSRGSGMLCGQGCSRPQHSPREGRWGHSSTVPLAGR